MASIPNSVKERLSLLEYLRSDGVELKGIGTQMKGRCPLCQRGKDAFWVDIAKSVFKCFACQAAGDIFEYVKLRDGVDFRAALETLAVAAGLEDELAAEGAAYVRSLREKRSQKGADSLKKGPVLAEPEVISAGNELEETDSDEISSKSTESSPDNDISPPFAASDEDKWGSFEKKAPTPFVLLRRFYEKLALSDADAKILFEKRGLDSRTADKLGFKSSESTNQEIIEAVGADFGVRERYWSGLFRYGRDKELKPNAQFFGYGLTGEETKDGTGKNVAEWGWTHPVLIPFFDRQGDLVRLSPHKGGGQSVRGIGFDFTRQRLYVPRECGKKDAFKPKTVVICEGAFKAAAVWQVIGAGSGLDAKEQVGVCALPGIQMAKTLWVWFDLCEYLDFILPSRVIVVFDNEEKGDPKLPGYNPKMEKRHDAAIWTEVLAMRLRKRFPLFDVRAGILPDEWRDEKGKADWDGYLANAAKKSS